LRTLLSETVRQHANNPTTSGSILIESLPVYP
jgi:hypothetical protein